MTPNEIAQAILNRPNPGTCYINQAEMQSTLGSDGMAEALRIGWLTPDMDSGFLTVSSDMGRVEQMQALAHPQESAPSQVHNLMEAHQKRLRLVELNAPMTGRPLGNAQQTAPAAPPPGQMVTSQRPGEGKPTDKQPQIGDSVMVAQEDETYQAKVQALANGKYKLTFGPKKPPQERDYEASELRLVTKAQTESLNEDSEDVPGQASGDAPGQNPGLPPAQEKNPLKQELLKTPDDLRELPESEYDLIDGGIEHCQYFQGIGSGDYDAVFVGTGDNPAEALSDALDQAAMDGWNVDHITEEWPDKPSVTDEIRQQTRNEIDEDEIRNSLDDPSDEEAFKEAMDAAIEEKLEDAECELYYYAAVRLRAPGSE
jgi:hypothetical protein